MQPNSIYGLRKATTCTRNQTAKCYEPCKFNLNEFVKTNYKRHMVAGMQFYFLQEDLLPCENSDTFCFQGHKFE